MFSKLAAWMFKLKAHSSFGVWSPDFKVDVYGKLCFAFALGFFHFALHNFPLNCWQLVCVCECVHLSVQMLGKRRGEKKSSPPVLISCVSHLHQSRVHRSVILLWLCVLVFLAFGTFPVFGDRW